MLTHKVSSPVENGRHALSRKNRTTMCSQCRHDKQKCNPADRDWDSRRQKCERCEKLDYPCGPSKRAQRRRKTTSLGVRTPNHYYEEGLGDSSLSELHDRNISSHVAYHSQHCTSDHSPTGFGSQCVGQEYASRRVDHGLQTYTEPWIAEEFMQLGDLYATRELLRRELKLCEQINNWVGFSNITSRVRAAIQDLIQSIQENFEKCVKKARNIVASGIASTMENMVKLYLIAYRFTNPPSSVTVDQGSDEYEIRTLESPDIQWLLRALHEHTSTYSSADLLCGNVSYSTTACSQAGTMETYREASIAIGRVLSKISMRSSECSGSLLEPSTDMVPVIESGTGMVFAYPACHLAAMHGRQSITLELCRNSPSPQRWELDCFQRTILHTAAYAGKIHELRSILEVYTTTDVNMGRDIFGLTPLMIVACQDDVETFTWLHQRGADLTVQDLDGRNAILLAVRNGSQSIVKFLLSQGCIPLLLYPESSELREAIVYKQGDIINLLIEHYSRHRTISQYDLLQIQGDITMAEREGLDITENLQSLYTLCSYKCIDSVNPEAHYICLGGGFDEASLMSSTSVMVPQQCSTEDANDVDMDWNPFFHPLEDLDFPDWTVLNSPGTTAIAPSHWP